MKIAIIGAGHVGRALAEGWSLAGHEVVLGARDPSKAQTDLRVETPGDAVTGAEVIVLAVPGAAAGEVAESLGLSAGQILIDCTNPIRRGDDGPEPAAPSGSSGGEEIARRLPGIHVVKTLNQVGAEVMATAHDFPARPVMFLAGDDADAKARVSRLLTDLGFLPRDAGALSAARLLEPYALIWIRQAMMMGRGRNWALSEIDHP